MRRVEKHPQPLPLCFELPLFPFGWEPPPPPPRPTGMKTVLVRPKPHGEYPPEGGRLAPLRPLPKEPPLRPPPPPKLRPPPPPKLRPPPPPKEPPPPPPPKLRPIVCAIRCAKELMGTTFFNFTRNCSCRIRPHKRLTCVLSAIAGSARQWHYDAPCTKLAFCMRQAHHHCTTKARKGKEVSDNWTWNSRAGFAMRTGGLPHGKSNQKRQGASIRPCFDGRRYFKASSRTVV